MTTALQTRCSNCVWSTTDFFSSVGPRLWNNFPLSLRDGSQNSSQCQPRHLILCSPSFLSRCRLLLRFSSASPLLLIVALVWNIGYPTHTEDLRAMCTVMKTLQCYNAQRLYDSAPLQTEKHTYIISSVANVQHARCDCPLF